MQIMSFDQSQKLKQQQQQHKKKAAGPFACARRENLPRQYRKYICIKFYAGIFVRHMQSLRLFLIYGSGFKVQ